MSVPAPFSENDLAGIYNKYHLVSFCLTSRTFNVCVYEMECFLAFTDAEAKATDYKDRKCAVNENPSAHRISWE